MLAGLTILALGASPVCLAAQGNAASVVVVTLDTTRADHLGCYGDKSIATPNLDALARSGARFANAFTVVPVTLPSHTALFTGSFPMATGVHDFSGNKLPPNAVTLAKVLHEHGYATAAFLGAAVLSARFGLNQGFDVYFDHFNSKRLDDSTMDLVKRPADQVVGNALAWLKTNPPRPFFLWVHIYDAHYPYTPPEPFASRYAGRPYDGEIAFVDSQLGRLFGFLEDMGVFQNAVVVVAGDHGEGLGEHGEKTHGFFIYNSTLHVPLIIKVPGASASTVEKGASLVDVMPTVLQALHLPSPPSVQGRSLLSDILGKPSSTTSNLYSECYLPMLHFGWSPLRGLQSEGLKFIDAPHPELYDVRPDPHETKNLYTGKRAVAQELKDRLQDVERRYSAASGSGAQAAEGTDPELAERLRSLGYVALSAGTYSDSSGKALADPKDRARAYDLISDAVEDNTNGRYKESLEKLHAAERIDPNTLPVPYLEASNYFRLEDYPHAAERYKAALKLVPNIPLATYDLAVSQLKIGDTDGAKASFQHALELDPTNFNAAFNLGMLELKQHQMPEAQGHLQQVVEINPGFAPAFAALGEVHLYLHHNDEAVRALEHAVSLDPNLADAHYNLGRAYEAVGRAADAQREFTRAQALRSP
jgi:arylsulfatase A-like enzyme/Flp pilus assembly protein TadD